MELPSSSPRSRPSSTFAASGAVAALNSNNNDDDEAEGSQRAATQHQQQHKEQQPQGEKASNKTWKGSLWNQFMTRTGLFAPLAPEDSPEAVAERQREAEVRRRQEKLESVHSWRPSQESNVTSPQKGTAKSARPSMMRKLSSAVELKWWSGDSSATSSDVSAARNDDTR